MKCNCENSTCPHHSFDMIDTYKSFKACDRESQENFKIMYIGAVCRDCYYNYDREYRIDKKCEKCDQIFPSAHMPYCPEYPAYLKDC